MSPSSFPCPARALNPVITADCSTKPICIVNLPRKWPSGLELQRTTDYPKPVSALKSVGIIELLETLAWWSFLNLDLEWVSSGSRAQPTRNAPRFPLRRRFPAENIETENDLSGLKRFDRYTSSLSSNVCGDIRAKSD